MTLAGGVSYTYDDNGNQVAAGSDTFDWDDYKGNLHRTWFGEIGVGLGATYASTCV